MTERTWHTGDSAWIGLPVVGLLCTAAWAGPEGAQVVHGTAKFQKSGDLTSINVSDNAIINGATRYASHSTLIDQAGTFQDR